MRLIVTLLLVLSARASEGQIHSWKVDTTCLVPYYHGDSAEYGHSGMYWDSLFNAIYNPDSIMDDTCDNILEREGFGIAKIGLHFHVPLVFPWAPKGTILEAPWTQIDTFFKTIRAKFKDIYDSISPYVIRKVYPDDTSSVAHSQEFEFHFADYVRLDSVVSFFGGIMEEPGFGWRDWRPSIPFSPGDFATVDLDKHDSYSVRVFPNPVSDYFYITSQTTGSKSFDLVDEIGNRVSDLNAVQLSPQLWRVDMSHTLKGIYFLSFGAQRSTIIKVN